MGIRNHAVQTVTIANLATRSSAIKVAGVEFASVTMPDSFNGDLTAQGRFTPSDTFVPIRGHTGDSKSVTVAGVAKPFKLELHRSWLNANDVRLVASTAQTAERTITIFKAW